MDSYRARQNCWICGNRPKNVIHFIITIILHLKRYNRELQIYIYNFFSFLLGKKKKKDTTARKWLFLLLFFQYCTWLNNWTSFFSSWKNKNQRTWNIGLKSNSSINASKKALGLDKFSYIGTSTKRNAKQFSHLDSS